jgi:lipid-A-disaccharide synthase
MPRERLSIFIVACEPSGDALGAGLMRRLKARSAVPLRFSGVGGERMAEEGLQSLFPLADLAVMGFAEVLPKLPRLLHRRQTVVKAIVGGQPDAVVTIDASSFNKGVARQLIRSGVTAPRIHYVAPMVWAWRPGRTRATAALFDHLLTLFPFEPPLFERAGMAVTCVGHPAVEAQPGDGVSFRARHGLPLDAPVLCLMPGSRAAEISALLPAFEAAVRIVRQRLPSLRLVLPTVGGMLATVSPATAKWPLPVTVVSGDTAKRDAIAASDAALAASGTVTLELALADVPMVITYRPNPLSGWLASRLIRIPHVGLPNILLGRPVVPELLRGDCRGDRLAAAVLPLLTDAPARARQQEGFTEIRRLLSADGRSPSDRAAEIVLALASHGRPTQTPSGTQPGAQDERSRTSDQHGGRERR